MRSKSQHLLDSIPEDAMLCAPSLMSCCQPPETEWAEVMQFSQYSVQFSSLSTWIFRDFVLPFRGIKLGLKKALSSLGGQCLPTAASSGGDWHFPGSESPMFCCRLGPGRQQRPVQTGSNNPAAQKLRVRQLRP